MDGDWGKAWRPIFLIGLLAAGIWFAWPRLTGRLSWERVGPKPGAARQAVVLLHGFGAPSDDLVGLAEELAPQLPQTTFAIPAGPHAAGLGGRAWVPDFVAPSREEYVQRLALEIDTTSAKIWKLVDSLRSSGLSCENIYLGGFSQGGRMAAEAALRAPQGCNLGGLIVMSGGGFNDAELPAVNGAPMRVLVAHGDRDSVVSAGVGMALAQTLAAGGHTVRWLSFQGAHQIPPEVRGALPAFLSGEDVGTSLP